MSKQEMSDNLKVLEAFRKIASSVNENQPESGVNIVFDLKASKGFAKQSNPYSYVIQITKDDVTLEKSDFALSPSFASSVDTNSQSWERFQDFTLDLIRDTLKRCAQKST